MQSVEWWVYASKGNMNSILEYFAISIRITRRTKGGKFMYYALEKSIRWEFQMVMLVCVMYSLTMSLCRDTTSLPPVASPFDYTYNNIILKCVAARLCLNIERSWAHSSVFKPVFYIFLR